MLIVIIFSSLFWRISEWNGFSDEFHKKKKIVNPDACFFQPVKMFPVCWVRFVLIEYKQEEKGNLHKVLSSIHIL